MNKLLYITSVESDYLQDLMYAGLGELLGFENVIDYPWKRDFHWPTKIYPRNLGYQSINFKNDFFRILKFGKVEFNEITAVVVASAKPDCLKNFLAIQSEIPKSIPVIFFDGGDWPEVGGDLKRLGAFDLFETVENKRKFDLIFKREVLIGRPYEDRVKALPFPAPLKAIEKMKFERGFVNSEQEIIKDLSSSERLEARKKYDVTFWAVESDEIRTKALSLIENKFDCKTNGTIRNQVFKKYKRKGDFYLQELSRSKVTLNFRGVGWDTLRYWEVPALGGFMISQKPKIEIPDNYIHGQEVIFCKDDLSDLVELCEYYLQNSVKREEIGKAGYEKTLKHHSELARAKSVMAKLV